MEFKIITLASFVYTDKIDSFTTYLNKRFNISKEKIFIYEIENDFKKILTYKVKISEDKKIDLRTIIPPTIMVHKRGDCLYSINGLNKLIESLNPNDAGNLDHSKYVIDWNLFQDKIILTNDEGLKITNITRIYPENR